MKGESQRAAENEKAIAAREKELARRYLDAYNKLDAELSKLYAKLGENPGAPMLVEARRAGRLAKLQKAIADEYRKVTGDAKALTQSQIAKSYADAYYGTAWAIDQEAKLAIKWPTLSVEAIREAVNYDETGDTYDARLDRWGDEGQVKVNQAITRGLALGDGYSKTASALKKQLNSSAYEAMRIVRTESTRAYTQGHNAVYDEAEEQGIKMRRLWVAALDERTRPEHARLDGTYADDAGLFYIGGDSAPGPGMFSDPAQSINCRCAVEAVIEEIPPAMRRTDKGIEKYQTFEEWARPKGWTPEKGWPKAKG